MEKLRAQFEMSGFSGDLLDKIIEAFHVKEYKKGDFFVEAGKISEYLGFIESGMFHYYVIKEGDERTSYVSIENTFVLH